MNPLEPIHPALELALAWQPASSRATLAALLALDDKLGAVVARASEPVLAQMRLAWWRERLMEPANSRPAGEPVLAELTDHWPDREEALVGLADGWEELLGEAPLHEDAIARFASARGKALAAFAKLAGIGQASVAAERVGRCWALADFAFRTSDGLERATALALAREIKGGNRLPAGLRGLAVLAALADRAIARGEPLCHGRAPALVALRVGITGR